MNKNRRNKSIAICKSRWFAYSVAGAASALGASAAEAEIHYSGMVNFPFPGTDQVSSAYFPLNSGANLFLQHFNLGSKSGAARVEVLGPTGRAGGSIGGLVGNFVEYGGFYVSNLVPHLKLSRLRFGAYCRYTSSGTELHCFGGTIGYSNRPNGKFRNPGEGFIGFAFDSGKGRQNGWARIKTNGTPANHFILLDYAWADPGESIQTGQKHGSDETATAANRGSLGLLALGGRGLMAWRQTRTTASQK
ncbi:MAG TPA: hypothetical protein VGI60_05825 [Chthoniobacterales bacterium]|jgi:hypothetical protein